MINQISLADLLSLVAILVAIGFVLAGKRQNFPTDAVWVLAGLLGLELFHHTSNLAEWSGFSAATDNFEDFLQILVPMLWGVFFYVMIRSQQAETLRQSEERFRAVFENSSDSIILVDGQGTILRVNPAAECLAGIQAAEMVGQKSWDLQARLPSATQYNETFNQQVKQIMQDMLATPNHPAFNQLLEGDMRRPDGSVVYFQQVVFPCHTSGRAMYAGLIRDISAQKLAQLESQHLNEVLEQRVEERTAELAQAYQELEAFSYSISHDLRAPLRAMDGYSRLALEDFAASLPDEVRRYLEIVHRSALTMSRMIDDLLRLSRLGRQALNIQSVQPGELVRELLLSFANEISERQVQVSVLDMPACQADRGLLQQVYANLISNALKFTRPCPQPRIEVGCIQRGSTPVYYVRDNGVGFDSQYAEKLFSVFQRLHSQKDYEGDGIGLALVQRIIRRHGGMIWAEAEINQGTTFYFTLTRQSNIAEDD